MLAAVYSDRALESTLRLTSGSGMPGWAKKSLDKRIPWRWFALSNRQRFRLHRPCSAWIVFRIGATPA